MQNNGKDESFKAIEEGGVPAAREFLRKHYHTALPALGGEESAAEQLVSNVLGYLGTVRTRDWTVEGKVMLIGDAAHAIVPFFGQGMNSGFEDVKELVALLDAHAPANARERNYATAFHEFAAARIPNANAIADMA